MNPGELIAMLQQGDARIVEASRRPRHTVTTEDRSRIVTGDNAWSLILPMPPSFKHAYAPVEGGFILKQAGRAYKQLVGEIVMTQRRGRPPLQGRLRLWVEMHAPDHRKRDLDNFCFMLVPDALQAAHVFEDDCQFDDIRGTRGAVSTPGYLAVLIDRAGARPRQEQGDATT